MKYTYLILLLLPFTGIAQENQVRMNPPAGKARVYILNDPYEKWMRVVVIHKAPFFVDGQLKCRLSNGTYSYIDVEPGTYTLAARESGKKLGKRTPVLELYAEEGTLYYLEMEVPDPFVMVVVHLRKVHVMEFEQLIKRRRSVFAEGCGNSN